MDIVQLLLTEFEEEAKLTRRMLERIPEDKWSWKPHERSMVFKYLVVHIAELPSWVTMGLTTSELDFATMDYKPSEVSSRDDVLKLHQASVESGRKSLQQAKEEDLLPSWTLRRGDQIFATYTKYGVVRLSIAQTIHHRAQLGVYLRLLDIPIPGTYGPSADETW